MVKTSTSFVLEAPMEIVSKVMNELEEFLEALPYVTDVRHERDGTWVTMTFTKLFMKHADTYKVESLRSENSVTFELLGRHGTIVIMVRADAENGAVKVSLEAHYSGRSEGLVKEKLVEILNSIRKFLVERISEELEYAPQIRKVFGRDLELSDVLSVSILLLSSTLLKSIKVPPGESVYRYIEKYVGEGRGLLLITIEADGARARLLIDNGRIEGAYLEKGLDNFVGVDALDEIRRLEGPASIKVWLVVEKRGGERQGETA
ncbi:MAG: hypothetical protein DRO12_05200 [Thermoprotei archaeon]|nr:MAG: hypothetical protein DRO12_05200 [Thermoprotei archaeon]